WAIRPKPQLSRNSPGSVSPRTSVEFCCIKTFPLEIQRLTEGKWRQDSGDGKKGICILHIAGLGDKLNSRPTRFFS
ncbi:MAG: hypothetical protein MI751_11090, partial [Pseudomonadales bacterium]|nr:hypothetical protein [Pseudomonadales bacterium]